jgi:CheY-like chemotaxis protein
MNKRTVVIIEDDELTRMVMQRILEREFKFNIVLFRNGLEGLEYLQKNSPVSPKLEGRAYCEYLGTYSFSTVPKTEYKFQ